MKRWLLLGFCVACSGRPPPSADGGDDGLPPPGDGGQVASLGIWEDLKGTDPEAYTLLAGFARAFHGQSADLEKHDGYPDLVVTREADGTLVRWYQVGRATFRPLWVSHHFPDGRFTLGIDVDESVFDDVVIEVDPKTQMRVERVDTNLNRAHDFRRLIQRDVDAGSQLVIEQTDPMENNQWSEVRRYTVSLSADQGGSDGCLGNSNFARFFGDPMINAGSNIGIVVEGAVKCEGENLKRVKAAVACAVKKVKGCLADSNSEAAARVQAALASSYLQIGCNNPCPGRDATTTTSASVIEASRMNLTSDIGTLDEDTACAVVLHELMHYGEVPHDESHPQGLDRIYACGRYCNRCVKRGVTGPPPSDMDDCVTCAGTPEERAKCGSKEDAVDGTCTGNALCSGGLAGNMPCSACTVKVLKDCKNARLDDQETYLCCKTCPNGYPTNPNECMGTPTLANSCGQKPPQCR